MRTIAKSAVRSVVLAVAGWLFTSSLPLMSQPIAIPGLKSGIASLGFFTGDWECSGTFDSSGKRIEAFQHFVPDLGGAWIVFRHDDKPPFNYHALAEWGWNADRKQFVMVVMDSFGGARLFRSEGWDSTKLQWEGDALEGASIPGQRFSFERIDDHHYKVSYFKRKSDGWSRVDSSTCSKQ